jgi:hypothetical protein
VKAGRKASFVVWVWTTNAASKRVSVTAKVTTAQRVGAPSFTVCPVTDGATCKLGNLPVGQAAELQTTVSVGARATLGEQVQISATATAAGSKSFTDSATDIVVARPAGTTAVPTPPVTTLPPTDLPTISGSGIAPSNPSSLFPTVGAGSPSPGASSLGLPPVKPKATVHVADASATVPLDTRLIGGQLAGLAVLAGAVAIAIARLSLRAPKPEDDATAKTQTRD